MKINTRLLISQGLLVLLSVIIVLLNIITFNNMESDANFINYAGKLRFINYKMSSMADKIINNRDDLDKKKEKLALSMEEYENLLNKLVGGCPVLKLKKLRHEETLEDIERFKTDWQGQYKDYYSKVLDLDSGGEFTEPRKDVLDYIEDIDSMVLSYSEFAENKTQKAIFRNGIMVIVIILVSTYSFISVRRKIKIPMNKLLRELENMNLIDDEITSKIDITHKNELEILSSYIDELIYDGLTRTYNRRTGLSRLKAIIEEGDQDLYFSLIFIDINGLKEVNDYLGHEDGDKLITTTVKGIKDIVRNKDFIVRLGGDEFLLALKNMNVDEAEDTWGKILNKYDEINNKMNYPFIVSVSHGIADYRKDKDTLESLIQTADQKMYEEKKKMKSNPDYKIIRNKQ